jgi:CelD/BcsL family acetyltransferase involved in cellulose biosynthesis
LGEVSGRCGKRFDLKRERPSFFLTLDHTYEDYLRRRSGSFRNALKRIERKLFGSGRIEIRTQHDFSNLDQAYESLLSVEQRSWKQEHGTAITAVSRQTAFYRRLCSLMSQKKWLRLEFLYLNDQPVAYNLGLVVKGTYFYLKTSYDLSERPLSPATFLRAKLIEQLIRQETRCFDFPGDPYEWESQWTDDVRWHHSFTLYGQTLKGLAYAFYRKASDFAKVDGPCHVAYVDPKSLRP